MDKQIQQFIFACINTVGFWLVHIVGANQDPQRAMHNACSVMPQEFNPNAIEDLDPDEQDDEDVIPF